MKNKKYQFLVDHAIAILDKKKIPHNDLEFKFFHSDSEDDGYAMFSPPESPRAYGKPLVSFNTQLSSELSEKDMKYCITHEIGHYRDWLKGDLHIGGFFLGYKGMIHNEKSANKFAKKIMGFIPDWLPREYK